MHDGPERRAHGAMLHDPKGVSWSKCSLLFVKFAHGRAPATAAQKRGAPREYLGKTYNAHVGTVELPPKNLSEWDRVGEVKEIFYTRHGTKASGRFRHVFNAPRGMMHVVFAVKGTRKVILYQRGSAYRIELGKGCIADDRGIAWP